MSNANINATAAATTAAISFTVKDGDIVTGAVAAIKKHPEGGILLVVANNPMAFMPNSCIVGSDAEKATRRADLIANPGRELTVRVLGEPTVVPHKTTGKPSPLFKVSERHAVSAKRAEQTAARHAETEAAVAALVRGSVVKGKVTGSASKPSDRADGSTYVYGAFVEVAPGITGLLHVRQVENGNKGLEAILAKGSVDVEIVDAHVEKGQPRVELSQKSVGQKAIADKAQALSGKNVRATVQKTGEVVDDIHGRILSLDSGEKVFLADDDASVKSESSLARGNTTRVIGTGEIVGGMMRVTRRGV